MRIEVLACISTLIMVVGIAAGFQVLESTSYSGTDVAQSASSATPGASCSMDTTSRLGAITPAEVDLSLRPVEAGRTKRTGQDSVEGVTRLRREVAKYSKTKTLKILKIHSSDGSDAGLTGATAMQVKAGNIEQAIKQAEADQSVIEMAIDRKVKAAWWPADDLYFQWALEKSKSEQAWTEATGEGVKVAVVDTGVHAEHEDLQGQILDGYDFVDEGADTNGKVDPHRHGTHVAGIIGAIHDTKGVTGLAHDAKIIPIRVLDERGWGTDSAVINGIIKAADLGADVINLSLGSTSDVYDSAVNYARGLGASVVSVTGNAGEYGSPLSYPGNAPGVIAVAATTEDDSRASFSSYNSSTDLSAPGFYIISTFYYNNIASWGYMGGTSMAAPYAAATIALTLQQARKTNPNARGVDVEDAVLGTARDLGEPGRDDEFGNGLIDPVSAIAEFPVSGGGEEPSEPEPSEPAPSLQDPVSSEPSEPEPTEEPMLPEPTEEPTEEPIVPKPTVPIPETLIPSKLYIKTAKQAKGKARIALTVKSQKNNGVRPAGAVKLHVQAVGTSKVVSYAVAPGKFSKTGAASVTIPVLRHSFIWATTSSSRSIISSKKMVRAKAVLRVTQKRKYAKRRTVIVNSGVSVRSVVRVQRKIWGKWRFVRDLSVRPKGASSLRLSAAKYRFATKTSKYFDSSAVSVRVR